MRTALPPPHRIRRRHQPHRRWHPLRRTGRSQAASCLLIAGVTCLGALLPSPTAAATATASGRATTAPETAPEPAPETGSMADVRARATSAPMDRSVLEPITECVIVNGDGTFTAFFGYDNRSRSSMTERSGSRNRLSGAQAAVPTFFATGRHVAVFSVTTQGVRITWRLDRGDAVATPQSQPCSTNPSVPEAPITLVLMLAPALVTGWWLRRRQRADQPVDHRAAPSAQTAGAAMSSTTMSQLPLT